MNTYWIVCAVLAIIVFAVGEAYAFKHPDRQNTLSHLVSTIGAKWPMSIWLMGVGTGILAAHFFWGWSANPIIGGG